MASIIHGAASPVSVSDFQTQKPSQGDVANNNGAAGSSAASSADSSSSAGSTSSSTTIVSETSITNVDGSVATTTTYADGTTATTTSLPNHTKASYAYEQDQKFNADISENQFPDSQPYGPPGKTDFLV